MKKTVFKSIFQIFKQTNFNLIVLFNSKQMFSCSIKLSKNYHRIKDYNFNYFHQNPIYKFSCIQVSNSHKNSPSLIDKNILTKEYIANLNEAEVIKIMENLAKTYVKNKYTSLVLKNLDKKCCALIENWSLEMSLYVFDMWFIILQQHSFQTEYFHNVLHVWLRNFKTFNIKNLVQILYYLGQHKFMTSGPIIKNLKVIEEKHYDMTEVEFSIVCLTLFKLRIKSVPEKLSSSAIRIAQDFMLSNMERFHLISILKFLRQVQVYDEKLYYSLEKYIIKEHNSFNFVECTNFLATFSSVLLYNKNVFELLEKQGILMLKNQTEFGSLEESKHIHPSLQSRVKDISRYLWAMISVGHSLKNTSIEVILAAVRKKFHNGEYKTHPSVLIDCLQSFALINIYPDDLLKSIFAPEFLLDLQVDKKEKPFHQMYFLYESLKLERFDLFKSLQLLNNNFLNNLRPVPKKINQEIKKRPDLMYLFNLIKQLDLPESEVSLCCSLPHIQILNIEFHYAHQKKILLIELLDSSVCCGNSEKLIGFMIAKLRQLNDCNYSIITLNQSDMYLMHQMSYSQQLQKIQELLSL